MSNPDTTLGARIRARRPSPIANNPFTNSRDPGSRAGYSPATGGSADSASRLEQSKVTGLQTGALSYEEAKEALGW